MCCSGPTLPAGVCVGDFLAEGFELGDQGAEAAAVVEPGLVVGELVVGQDPGDGLAVYFAGPLVVGAVEAGGLARQRQLGYPQRVIRSARVPGRMKPAPVSPASSRRGGGAGPLGGCGRHVIIFAARVPCLGNPIKYKSCMNPAEVAAYIGRWQPSSVPPGAAAFARDVVTAAGPDGQDRAKNLLWAAGKLAA